MSSSCVVSGSPLTSLRQNFLVQYRYQFLSCNIVRFTDNYVQIFNTRLVFNKYFNNYYANARPGHFQGALDCIYTRTKIIPNISDVFVVCLFLFAHGLGFLSVFQKSAK